MYGSRPRAHTRSIPPGPYLDPYPMILHDPYPWSIPLSRWRKTAAGPNAAFYPNTASGPRTATAVATTASAASALLLLLSSSSQELLLLLSLLLLLLLVPLLVLVHFLRVLLVVGQMQTSWLATSNIASAPWRLVRPVLVPLRCF